MLSGKKVSVKVPAGARAGQKIRLAGKGFPNKKGDPGDFYLVLSIAVPPKPTDEEKELYKKLSEISTFDPRADL